MSPGGSFIHNEDTKLGVMAHIYQAGSQGWPYMNLFHYGGPTTLGGQGYDLPKYS